MENRTPLIVTFVTVGILNNWWEKMREISKMSLIPKTEGETVSI
jgi:hypothetical protein